MAGIFCRTLGKFADSSDSCSCSCSNGDWTGNLHFFSCDKFEYTQCNVSMFIQHDEMNRKLKALLDDETIETMKIYTSSLNITCAKCLCQHQYIVFRTKSLWYSLEKFQQCITMQRGSKQEMVTNQIIGEPRRRPKQHSIVLDLPMYTSVHWIIQMLHTREELLKPYTLWENNCIRFVCDVRQSLSAMKDRSESERSVLYLRNLGITHVQFLMQFTSSKTYRTMYFDRAMRTSEIPDNAIIYYPHLLDNPMDTVLIYVAISIGFIAACVVHGNLEPLKSVVGIMLLYGGINNLRKSFHFKALIWLVFGMFCVCFIISYGGLYSFKRFVVNLFLHGFEVCSYLFVIALGLLLHFINTTKKVFNQ
ncbi:uncharacterized protein LOC127854058 [Dreissena polymorpha]|uniref:uncharacterized protein LOC127854058 n=1 Tax=Dreissena polymorpha TaxID=45954 RepID=UPI0022641939|nr:uncharacterized protein LOC127854058 [Dreissena polymorpha]